MDPDVRTPVGLAALDPASAVVYAVRARFRPGQSDAAWAAELPVHTLETRLEALADGETYRVERFAGQHPAVVAERRRQQRDLAELAAAAAGQDGRALSRAVVAVRARAREQSLTRDWPTELPA